MLPFLGPAFVASVAYMDPGNFATNIQAGADYGYMLLWVLLVSNLMAILIQSLSAKLGIASGMTLPQAIRAEHRAPRQHCALAVRRGGGDGHRPGRVPGRRRGHAAPVRARPVPVGLLTAIVSFAMLAVQQRGHTRFELLIMAFVGVIGACFFVEIFIANPDPAGVLKGMLVPHMPRQRRLRGGGHGRRHRDATRRLPALRAGAAAQPILSGNSKREHFRRELVDIALAMNGAWLINSSMVIMAAAVFYASGTPVNGLEDAQATLQPLLGSAAAYAFGIALLASGLSSSTVGTMAGQMIVDGFMQWRVSVFVRRFITMVPALVVIALGTNTLTTLIASQVVLSLVLPFAVVPLVWLTSRRDIMGDLVNSRLIRSLAVLVAAMVIGMNVLLLGRHRLRLSP